MGALDHSPLIPPQEIGRRGQAVNSSCQELCSCAGQEFDSSFWLYFFLSRDFRDLGELSELKYRWWGQVLLHEVKFCSPEIFLLQA